MDKKIIEMKNFLFIIFLINSISIYAESKFTLKGEIIDYNTKESFSGALINFYSEGIFVERMFSDKNGNFEFTTTKPIDVIEVKYIGKLTIKIIDIDVYNEKIKDFSFRIPLFDNPFGFIGYEKKPTFSQRQKEKEKRKFILKGVPLECKNDDKARIKYLKKGDYQFIKFIDLINCER